MGAIGVVTCPVCGESYLCADEAIDDRERLKGLTRAHLREHDLSETKVGIYGVQMADEHSRLRVSSSDAAEAGIGTWLEGEVDPREETAATLEGGPAGR